jgi:hypothetical protein
MFLKWSIHCIRCELRYRGIAKRRGWKNLHHLLHSSQYYEAFRLYSRTQPPTRLWSAPDLQSIESLFHSSCFRRSSPGNLLEIQMCYLFPLLCLTALLPSLPGANPWNYYTLLLIFTNQQLVFRRRKFWIFHLPSPAASPTLAVVRS